MSCEILRLNNQNVVLLVDSVRNQSLSRKGELACRLEC